jgi:transposase
MCRAPSSGLIERGERVLSVTTKLMADSRRRARGRGKSDSIDAIAVAQAALREGLDVLPAAAGGPLTRSALARGPSRAAGPPARCAQQHAAMASARHLPELRLPGSSLFYGNWGPRVARRLARAEQTMRVRIARDELRRIRELSQTIKVLEAEIAQLVARIAPQLLSEPGFGPLTAAKLVGEIAGADRFASDAKLARGRRGRSDPRQLGQDQPPPPRPRRQPPDQHDHPPHRRHPPALPPRNPALHRPQTRRRQEHQRSHPLPQTPPRPPPPAPTPATNPGPARHQALDIGAAKAIAGEGPRMTVAVRP